MGSLTLTVPLSLLMSPPLLPPVPTTLLPEVALLADSTPELLLDLTATVPATATALLLTPTVPSSPSMSPLFRPPVPITLLPREPSTENPGSRCYLFRVSFAQTLFSQSYSCN